MRTRVCHFSEASCHDTLSDRSGSISRLDASSDGATGETFLANEISKRGKVIHKESKLNCQLVHIRADEFKDCAVVVIGKGRTISMRVCTLDKAGSLYGATYSGGRDGTAFSS